MARHKIEDADVRRHFWVALGILSAYYRCLIWLNSYLHYSAQGPYRLGMEKGSKHDSSVSFIHGNVEQLIVDGQEFFDVVRRQEAGDVQPDIVGNILH